MVTLSDLATLFEFVSCPRPLPEGQGAGAPALKDVADLLVVPKSENKGAVLDPFFRNFGKKSSGVFPKCVR